MSAEPLKRLLAAKPFVAFGLHIGPMDVVMIEDASWCEVNEIDHVVCIKSPDGELAEIVDLDAVVRISFGSFQR